MTRALDAHPAAKRPTQARGAKPTHYGHATGKQGWRGLVERIADPRQRSEILLVMCRVCRQFQLEGSHALGYCRTCGTVNA